MSKTRNEQNLSARARELLQPRIPRPRFTFFAAARSTSSRRPASGLRPCRQALCSWKMLPSESKAILLTHSLTARYRARSARSPTSSVSGKRTRGSANASCATSRSCSPTARSLPMPRWVSADGGKTACPESSPRRPGTHSLPRCDAAAALRGRCQDAGGSCRITVTALRRYEILAFAGTTSHSASPNRLQGVDAKGFQKLLRHDDQKPTDSCSLISAPWRRLLR